MSDLAKHTFSRYALKDHILKAGLSLPLTTFLISLLPAGSLGNPIFLFIKSFVWLFNVYLWNISSLRWVSVVCFTLLTESSIQYNNVVHYNFNIQTVTMPVCKGNLKLKNVHLRFIFWAYMLCYCQWSLLIEKAWVSISLGSQK